MPDYRPTRHGFSLIELLVTLIIAAILASVAWPAYQNQVMKGRRSDAINALASIAQAQERWRADNPLYQSDLTQLPGGMLVSPGLHYDLSVVQNSTSRVAYILRATVRSGSPQSRDQTCQMMQMAMSQGLFTYTSSNGSGANSGTDPCWPQ